ncbi:MAG: hypothetical protein DI629_15430 [Mesorhizobium amorphae]|nr:MAG: hypothetical protein DI629_15430 [Mesorhizobium amorphae]
MGRRRGPEHGGVLDERPLDASLFGGLESVAAADAPLVDRPHYHGHRQRLRDRFRESGAGALSDYELLEMVLFRSIPRGDTKPQAKALLKRFGSLAEVMGAPEARLREVEGIGEAAAQDIKLLEALAHRVARSGVVRREVLSSWDAVVAYCRLAMSHAEREEFRILFLDKKNALIADEVQQTGTIDHTPVYPREVVKRSLELGATAVILVHNHPSGDPTPSKADIEMTKAVMAAAKTVVIAVHDHIIVGRKGHASLKGLMLI